MTGTYNLNLTAPTTLGGIAMISSSGTPTSEVLIGGSALTMINGDGSSPAQIRIDATQPRLVINSDIVNSGSGGLSLTANSNHFVINGSISGNKVAKSGSGSVFLGGSNSWSGGTTVDAGVLVATSTSAFGFTGTLRLGTGSAIAGISTLANGTTTVSSALDFNTTGNVTLYSGGMGSTLDFTTSSITNTSNGALILARALGNTAYGIADATGTGVVKFSGSDFTITRNISSTNLSDLELAPSSGTQTFSGSLNTGGAKLIKSGNGTVAYQGNITGGATKIDVNLGTMILSGTNSYSGATTINGGKLVVGDGTTGSIGNTALSVSAGTLTGSLASGNNIGTSLVTIGNGAGSADSIITAGSQTAGSIGRLALAGALTLGSDANFVFDLNTTSGVADQVLAAGTTTINSSSLFTFNAAGSNAGLSFGQTFTALGGAGAITGEFSNLANNGFISSNGVTLQANNYTGVGDLVLTVTVVPEPSSWLLLVASGSLLFLRRRVSRGNV